MMAALASQKHIKGTATWRKGCMYVYNEKLLSTYMYMHTFSVKYLYPECVGGALHHLFHSPEKFHLWT